MENNPFIYTKAFVPDNAEVEIDDFKRKPYAQQVSSIITSRREKKSIVVGIYGKWGEGKTTLLNFIKNELDKQKDIVCIQYNPWYYSDEAALIQNFFDNILEKLEKVSSSTDLIKQIKKYKKFLTQLSVSKSATVNLGVVQLDMDIGSSLSKSFVDLLKTKEIIQEMLGKQNIRIVFLMDDIDRLDKTEIQSIFKLVKLSADFDYIDYILAFDDKMVASALGEKYGSSNIESGRSFLEKIINVPLHLPQASETDLSKFLRKGMDKNVIPLIKSKVKEEDYDTFWRHFYFGMQIMLKTPRLAKLYQNSLIFSIPLLEDEVNLIDLMLIEGIRIFYPKMYNVIKSNAKLFVNQKAPIFQSELEGIIQTESEEIIQNIIETGFEGLYVQEQDSLKYLLIYLFPVTRKFLPNKTIHISEDQSLLERDKQIASPYYFYRYFCYTVPIGDISDIEMNDLIENINENEDLDDREIENISAQITSMINIDEPESVNLFNSKILKYKNKLSSTTSQKLVLVLSKLLREPPNELSQYVIDELLKTMQPEILIQCSRKLVESTVSTCFAVHIYETVLIEEMKISPVNIEHIKNIIENKIRDDIYSESKENEPIYMKYHCIYRIFGLLLEWGWKEKLSEYFEKSFSSKPDNAINFLKSLSTTVHGNGIYKEFMEGNYNFIKKLINPDTLYNILHDKHADILDTTTIEFYDNEENRILKSFSTLYKNDRVSKE